MCFLGSDLNHPHLCMCMQDTCILSLSALVLSTEVACSGSAFGDDTSSSSLFLPDEGDHSIIEMLQYSL